MLLFEKPGAQNTAQAIVMAVEQAKAHNVPIVCASTYGDTALALISAAKAAQLSNPIVVVRTVSGFSHPGVNRMEDAVAQKIREDAVLITAAHTLSGAERGLSRKYHGVYPVEIIADTLRMLGQGVKVCVECAIMALDAGEIPFGTPVVSIGGTSRGADTVLSVTPGYASTVLNTKIHAIYCKPALRQREE